MAAGTLLVCHALALCSPPARHTTGAGPLLPARGHAPARPARSGGGRPDGFPEGGMRCDAQSDGEVGAGPARSRCGSGRRVAAAARAWRMGQGARAHGMRMRSAANACGLRAAALTRGPLPCTDRGCGAWRTSASCHAGAGTHVPAASRPRRAALLIPPSHPWHVPGQDGSHVLIHFRQRRGGHGLIVRAGRHRCLSCRWSARARRAGGLGTLAREPAAPTSCMYQIKFFWRREQA